MLRCVNRAKWVAADARRLALGTFQERIMSIVEREPAAPTEPLLITAGELAELLHVSLRTLWRLNSARLVPEPVRLGKSVRWRREEIICWISEGCPQP
jgi:predicted DNA-binding transcriptional regulator AlpA